MPPVLLIISTALIVAAALLLDPALISIISDAPGNALFALASAAVVPATVPTFLRFRDLKERGIVSNWPTLTRWVREQGFPPGRQLGPSSRVWTVDEINAWIESRPTEGLPHARVTLKGDAWHAARARARAKREAADAGRSA